MFHLLQQRQYRIILTANFISLFGSGLNHASIIWFVLQKTNSANAVALLVTAITLPSLFFMPFSGVMIDRLDRRHTTMALDALRGLCVAVVAVLAFAERVEVWHIYAMGIMLGLGAFMFWPNMAALTQELVESEDVVPLNALVMGTAQGGWMIAGAVVGFLYQRIGLAGTLAMDAATYVISVFLMLSLRRGKRLVHSESVPLSIGQFNRDFVAGLRYVASQMRVLILGAVSALFTAAMMSQNVVTAPFSKKILHAGAAGFGFCNAGWSLGAITSSALTGTLLRQGSGHLSFLAVSLILAAAACGVLPHFGIVAVGVALYFVMGAGRGMAGVSVSSSLMHEVPKQLMGRTQNVINFSSIVFQLALTMAVGWLCEQISLAMGFYVLASVYLVAGVLATIVTRIPASGTKLEPPSAETEALMPRSKAAEL